MDTNFEGFTVIDAKDRVLGRVASTVAKELLNGKRVAIVNAEMAFVTGNKIALISKYRTRLNLQEKENPEHSPYWPRRPDMLVRRVVRGMLPYHKKPSGKTAYRNLRVFMGVPSFLSKSKITKIETKEPRKMYVKYLYVKELSRLLGYNSE
ncbi:MAG: 50S ribosomal protein L13 [Candidatus Micrarchaeota archaeon]|nr:50S ribosomal protein L13 [Candidatus Micrarchaeota archaeon]